MSRRTPEQRERRNAAERERRRTDPEWVERVNARRRVEPRPPVDPEELERRHQERREERLRRRREKYAELAAQRPPKHRPKPTTKAGMADAVESSLRAGGWEWVSPSGRSEGAGARSQPPMLATHPATGRMVWLEVCSDKPPKPPRRNASWRVYLADQGCDIRMVHPASLFDVCAELDPSLSAFITESGS